MVNAWCLINELAVHKFRARPQNNCGLYHLDAIFGPKIQSPTLECKLSGAVFTWEDEQTLKGGLAMKRPANSPLSPDAALALDLYFATEAPGLNCWALRRSREGVFARFYSMPDAALDSMGLSREGLAHWVFRDLFST